MRLRLNIPAGALALLLLLLTGCAGGLRGEKLSYDAPGTTAPPETAIREGVLLGGQNVGGRRISELAAMLSEHAAASDFAPVDAAVNKKTWRITPEKAGKRLNVDKTLEALKNAAGGERVDYVFEKLQPAVTADMLRGKIRVIGEYTTVLLDRSDSRVNNIRLASRKIDGTVLEPGEEFSFNRIVGKRTAAKGYEEAPIIIRTPEGPKKKKANGGGVCQISTTIYNAVEECGLKVTERHLHSKDVGYVPRGDDATVSYGAVDFRFVNTRANPIMLRLEPGTKSITVRIIENSSGSW